MMFNVNLLRKFIFIPLQLVRITESNLAQNLFKGNEIDVQFKGILIMMVRIEENRQLN